MCPVCMNWAGDFTKRNGDHHLHCPVPGAAIDLLAACKAAIYAMDLATEAGLARDGKAYFLLRDAIALAEGTS